VKSFKNAKKDKVEEWLQVTFLNRASMNTGIMNACVKQKGGEESGEDEREVRESSESVSHSTVLQCVETLHLYMGQKWVQMQ
jgi:hypothetical protein